MLFYLTPIFHPLYKQNNKIAPSPPQGQFQGKSLSFSLNFPLGRSRSHVLFSPLRGPHCRGWKQCGASCNWSRKPDGERRKMGRVKGTGSSSRRELAFRFSVRAQNLISAGGKFVYTF